MKQIHPTGFARKEASSFPACFRGWLGLFLLLIDHTMGGAVELRVGNVFAVPGGTVLVPVRFTTDTKVVAAQFDLLFPGTNVTSGDALAGPALVDHRVTSGEPDAAVRRVVVYSPTNATIGDGVLVTIPLTLASNTPYGTISLTLSNVVLGNYDGSVVTNIARIAGTLTCAPIPVISPGRLSIVPGGTIALLVPNIPALAQIQWQFSGADLAGQTNSYLVLKNIQPAEAGDYSVNISVGENRFNSTATVSVQTTLSNGLVAYFPFDGDFEDKVDHGHDGTSHNAAFAMDRRGRPNAAGSFNGLDSYVRTSATGLPTNDRTVSFWYYCTNTGPSHLLGYGGGAVCGSSFFMVFNGPGSPDHLETGGHCGTNPLRAPMAADSDGRWHHWAVTIGASLIRMYIDGAPVALANSFASPTFVNGKDLILGNVVPPDGTGSSGGPGYFDGLLDEIHIYNRALSPDEVNAQFNSESPQWLSISQPPQGGTFAAGQTVNLSVQAQGVEPFFYQWLRNGQPVPDATNATLTISHAQFENAGQYSVMVGNPVGNVISAGAMVGVTAPDLVAWWPGEGNTKDLISGLDFTVSGNFTFDPDGHSGQAFQFNGNSILIGAAGEVINPQKFTVSFWLRSHQALGTLGWIWGRNPSADSALNSIDFRVDTGGSLNAYITGESEARQVILGSDFPISDGVWRHFTMTYDQVNLILYRDGNQIGSVPASFGFLPNAQPLVLGRYPTSPSSWFNGSVDELALFKRALSPAEVARVYRQGIDTTDTNGAAPYFFQQPVGSTNAAGTSVVLQAGVVGAGPLFFQWLRNGQPVPDATNATLTLANSHPVQSGNYTVAVSNAVGLVTSAVAQVAINWFDRGFTREGTFPSWSSHGVAVADFDGDGLEDVFLADPGGPSHVLHNLGGGRFSTVTGLPAGFDLDATSGAAADYDNDGDNDLFIVRSLGPCLLFRNRGDGTFEDVTTQAGITDGLRALGAVWLDYDRDGYLDLFVTAPNNENNRLYHNRGDDTFEAITVGALVHDGGNSHGAAAADFDNDGWPDLIVANRAYNSQDQNLFLYRNDQHGGFTKITEDPLVLPGLDAFSVAVGDFDHDGDLDVRVMNFQRNDLLFRNDGGKFTRIEAGPLTANLGAGFSDEWVDYNDDGNLDLFATGWFGTPNRLFRQVADGSGTSFVAATDSGELAASGNGLGQAWFDADGNGTLDAIVASTFGPGANLYLNAGSGAANLTVRLIGRASNRSAIGTVLRATATIDGQVTTQRRDLQGASGYAMDTGIRAHFGLGDATNITTLRIEWPSGLVTELHDVAPNQLLTVEEFPFGTPVVRVNGKFSPTNRHEFLSRDPVAVRIASGFPDAEIHYTTDGTEADAGSELYTGPFTVTPSTVINAVAFPGDFSDERHSIPVVTVFIPTYTLTDQTPGGGGIILDPPGGSYPSNRVVSVIATNAPGWSFLRWEDDLAGTNPTNLLTMDSAKGIRAIFGTGLSTKVTGGAVNGAAVIEPASGPYPYGSTARLVALPAAGKYFLRWSGSGNNSTNSPLAFAVTTTNASFTAVFSSLPTGNRTLTVLVQGQGDVVRSPKAAFYANNTTVNLTPVPDSGWVFDGWAGDATGVAVPLAVTLDANKSVTAKFRYNGGLVAPSIVTEPTDLALLKGQTATFTVGATGSAPLAYQWWFNDAPLVGETATSLVRTSLKLTDSGRYFATVTNVANSVTSRVAQLTVSLPANVPPVVALLSPVITDSFRAPTHLVLLARATDSDGTVARVDFFAAGLLLGSSSDRSVSNTFTYTWTNATVGTNAVFVRAVDDVGGTASTLPLDVVVLPPEVTTFRWALGNLTFMENAGTVQLTVLKSGAGAGSVDFATEAVSAELGRHFLEAVGTLPFAANESAKTVSVRLLDNFVPDAGRQLAVRLSGPSAGTQLGQPSVATVTIMDDDGALLDSSLYDFHLSASRPAERAQLQVVLTPPEAHGQWRLPWETQWRDSGAVLSDLDPGNYPVEFRPVVNFAAPVPVTNGLPGGQFVVRTNAYVPDPNSLGGSYGVVFSQLAQLLASGNPGWRFAGETLWRTSGEVGASVAAGIQVIEFRAVPGWATPSARDVLVQPGITTTQPIAYLLAPPPPTGVTTPTAFGSYQAIRNGQTAGAVRQPFPMVGQLRSPAGYGSGIGVRDRVVLTAAHVLFDENTTNFVDPGTLQWFPERQAGEYEPRALTALGFYVPTNYLSARLHERLDLGLPPGVSTAASEQWDVAAIYFGEPAARDGRSGYLLSNADNSEWFISSAYKELLGYPLTGVNDGRMYFVPGDNYTFTHDVGPLFLSSQFLSYPGNSGGSLCVQDSSHANAYFPAGVYLGSRTANGRTYSVVRAIDGTVASLVGRAQSAAELGLNFNGGGVTSITAGKGLGQFGPSYLKVNFSPPSAVAAGAGWRLSGRGELPYLADGVAFPSAAMGVQIEFKPLPGFRTPDSVAYQFPGGGVTQEQSIAYVPDVPNVAAVLQAVTFGEDGRFRFTVIGPTGAHYIIQSSADLQTWNPVTTVTAPFTFESVPPPDAGGKFYRAVSAP